VTVNRTHNGREQLSDTVLVTGCSTGLGFEIALYLAEQGLDVYATVRDLSQKAAILDAARARDTKLRVLQLDITDASSIDAAVKAVLSQSGGIYGLVNNAGIGVRGCLEDLTEDEIRPVFETNLFGTVALTRAVLPHMRAARRGRILTIGSVGGRISTFGLSMYCASKFAQEGFGEALALEVAPFGLQAILIEPGIVNTSRWSENRGVGVRALDPSSAYARLFQRAEALADRQVLRSKIKPVDVARATHRALTARRPKMRYVVGRPAAAAILLRRYLPEPLFERIYFGLLLRQIASSEEAAPIKTVQPVQEDHNG
jgi:NAD(P)-dependent dehydrogenase (short-subunit alcohol dehydrogenase family)